MLLERIRFLLQAIYYNSLDFCIVLVMAKDVLGQRCDIKAEYVPVRANDVLGQAFNTKVDYVPAMANDILRVKK